MFRARTVLIIGAGASAEFKFPLGSALLTDIAEKIDISYHFGQQERGDHVIAQALRNLLDANTDVTAYNEHLHSAWQVVASAKQGLSIDNVLHALEDERASTVGKFGIVRSILAAENASPLKKWVDHSPDQIDVTEFADTWLGALTKLLTEGRTKSEVGGIFDNLAIINFNYDRVIEHYLPFSISSYYGLKPDAVREVMPSLKIYRPYGKAGSLPWEKNGEAVPFGHCSANDLQVASEQILTFTEQVEDQELVGGICDCINTADRIVFLGFGFHRQNVELLSHQGQKHVEIIGTSLGISKSDTSVICDEIEKSLGLYEYPVGVGHSYVKLHPLTSAEFISEVWRTLTAEPGEDPTIELPSLKTTEFPRISRLGL